MARVLDGTTFPTAPYDVSQAGKHPHPNDEGEVLQEWIGPKDLVDQVVPTTVGERKIVVCFREINGSTCQKLLMQPC